MTGKSWQPNDEEKGKERKGTFLKVSSRSCAGALIGDTVN